MTKNELIKLVSEQPHAIWAILQEAAYIGLGSLCDVQAFEKNEELLKSIAKHGKFLRDYREIILENLFADYGHKRHTLYVYSKEGSPNGITEATLLRMIGDADSYTTAADLWDAACATARVLGDGKIGLAIKVKED
jgi:hypothetical protein